MVLTGELGGGILGSWGEPRITLRVWGNIDRADFGLFWNHVLEAGGALVAWRVPIAVVISAVKVPASKAGTEPRACSDHAHHRPRG